MTAPDFDPATLPWVDRDDFPAEAARRRAVGMLDDTDAAGLESWRRDGYLALPGAVPTALIDDLLGAYEDGWRSRPDVRLLVEGEGEQPWSVVPPRESLGHHHYRVIDFHDACEATRRVMFHPSVVDALRLIFDARPVVIQSLLFEYSSEQRPHQDFPYVQAEILSHLIGCWVALEDTGPDNGPLYYYAGSHRIPKFRWNGGPLAWNGEDHAEVERFEKYLERVCADAGFERRTLHASKGDVFLWHCALVHGGSPVINRNLTRKSYVMHFSTRSGYPRDRRWPQLEPEVERIGGGYLYRRPASAVPNR